MANNICELLTEKNWTLAALEAELQQVKGDKQSMETALKIKADEIRDLKIFAKLDAEAAEAKIARLSERLAEVEKVLEPSVKAVLAERQRQKDVEGWTPEHDDAHTNGEMGRAAGVYALAASDHDYRWVLRGSPVHDYLAAAMKLWPWSPSWFKPTNRRRDLVKAGALILAEIERIDRLATLTKEPKS